MSGTTSELERADVFALAASIYERQPRNWINVKFWACPQCGEANKRTTAQCRCGISRDGLPEFCQRGVERASELPTFQMPAWAKQDCAESREPSPLLGAAAIAIAASVLRWTAIIAAFLKWIG